MTPKLRIAAAIACTAILLPIGMLAAFALRPLKLSGETVEFSIRTGSSLRAAARQMSDAGIQMPESAFAALARLTSNDTRVKAGSYQVRTGISPWQILNKITQGDFDQDEVLFVEGWTFRQLRAALDSHASVRHDSVALTDAQIMAAIGTPGVYAEGMFFPDTYLFARGESDLVILRRAHGAMQKQLQSAWDQRAGDIPLSTAYQALILASIVEKETGRDQDRMLISGVLANRLRAGMRLQADPTVIYGLGDKFDGNLRKRDLMRDTPFNTYTRLGLPPSPIAMPGRASLVAAVNPAQTGALYFVARADGSSEFSRSLEEHNRAVARHQRPVSGQK